MTDGERTRAPEQAAEHERASAETAVVPAGVGRLPNRAMAALAAGFVVNRDAQVSQGAGPLDPTIASNIQSAIGSGQPLPAAQRSELEGFLGADLGSVRVHDDARADELSRSVNAKAFTTGVDVFFRSGQFQPGTNEGRRLLAHEVTHTLQRSAGKEGTVVAEDDASEREADAVADQFVVSRQATAAGTPPESPQSTGSVGTDRAVEPAVGRSPAVRRETEPDDDAATGDDAEGGPTGVSIPWRANAVRSIVIYFRPFTTLSEDEATRAAQAFLAANGNNFNFSRGEPNPLRLSGISHGRFIELMEQEERTEWTIAAAEADDLFSRLGITRRRFEESLSDRDELENVQEILEVFNRPIPELRDVVEIEFPPDAPPEDLALFRRFINEVFSGQQPTELAEGGNLFVSSAELAAVKELYEESEARRNEVLEQIETSQDHEQEGGVVQVDNVIESARAKVRIKNLAEQMNHEVEFEDREGARPIVARPVRGSITRPGGNGPENKITKGMDVAFSFQVTDRVSAYRVPHVSIRWQAVQKFTRSERQIETETTNYIDVRDDSLINDKTFEVDFPRTGNYEIRAIVNHNFYTADAFVLPIQVYSTDAVAEDLMERGDDGFVENAGQRPRGNTYDFEELSDLGSYDEGRRYFGTLTDEQFAAGTGSFDDGLRAINRDIATLQAAVDHYRNADPPDRQIIEWTEQRITRLQQTKSRIQSFSGGNANLPILIRGYYVSRTSGVPHKQLNVVAWFQRRIADDGEASYHGGLFDHTGVARHQDSNYRATRPSYLKMVEALFLELSEDYPDGNMVVRFQMYERDTATQRMVTFERQTETLLSDIADVAFSPVVGTVVNVVAAMLTVFPPTTGLGIAVGLAYNGASTAYEIGEAMESDTLNASHAVDVGLLALDLIPVIGKGIRGVATAGRTVREIGKGSRAYHLLTVGSRVAEYAGETYVMSQALVKELNETIGGQVLALAQQIERVEHLRAQGAPPQILRREMMSINAAERRLRSTTVRTIVNFAGQQAITLASPALAGRLAQGHVDRTRHRVPPPPNGEPDGPPRPRQHPDVEGRDRNDPDADARPEDGRDTRPDGAETRLPDAAPPPERIVIGGREIVVRPSGEVGDGVRVQFDPDSNGMISRIWVEVGSDATMRNLREHMPTVQLMQRYQGLSGAFRILITRLHNAIERFRGIEGEIALPVRRAFEAEAEVNKLVPMITERAVQLRRGGLTELQRADLMATIDHLREQLRDHRETLATAEAEIGLGYVAATGAPRSNAPALAAGYPPLSQAPGHYYVANPAGGYHLRRFQGSSDPPKQIAFDSNGRPVVQDRTNTRIVHPQPEALAVDEARTYTGPRGTTATATRRRDGTLTIESTVGPSLGRLGYEHHMLRGVEVLDRTGWERAHSQGNITGHESAFGILYAPQAVNQQFQRLGIEGFIRDLNGQVGSDVTLRLITETRAHPGTRRLESITYRVDAVAADGRRVRMYEARIEVQDSLDSPRVHASAERYFVPSEVSGRAPGTDPAPSRPDANANVVPAGPLPREVAELTSQMGQLVDRVGQVALRVEGMEHYRQILLEAQRELRLEPASPERQENARQTIADVEEQLSRFE